MAKLHSNKFLDIVNAARKDIHECTIDDVKRWLDEGHTFHMVDVREESEFAAAHIVGATHLGKGVIERDIEKTIPNTDDEIVLYCGGGYRSALAAVNLQKMGYTKVISMDGGFGQWNKAGYPVEN